MPGPREKTSAGGVVVRTNGGTQVCLIRPTGRTVWGLPKGGIEDGETAPQAAVREVSEETGIQGVVDAELGSIDYTFYSREEGGRIHKTVHYFLMHATGGDTANHDHEFDVVTWRHLSEAERLLTHRNQLPMLHRAWERIARIPA